MEDPVHLYLVGTAGCGKSKLTWALNRWYDEHGLDAATVNIDPGAERLPYGPDIDIRDWLTLEQVMDEYSLGPNGAQVMAADLLALRAGEVEEVMEGFRPNVFLFDTPGQTELFVFRESGRILMDVLGRPQSAVAFLVDPFLARRPSAFVSQLLLSATTQFRFQVPVVNVLTKTDLVSEEEVARILRWSEEPDSLLTDLYAEQGDLSNALNTDVFRALESMGAYTRLTPVSAESLEGVDDVVSRVQEVFAGGEDARPD